LAARQQDRARGHSPPRRRRWDLLQPYDLRHRARERQTIPYGIKIYVPFIKQYFIREDLCAASGPKKGSGSNGCKKLWFDLWIGGDAKSKAHAVIKCERALTPNAKVPVILYPKEGMPVAYPGPIYRDAPPPNGTCDGKPEGSDLAIHA
ncbi:MAG TPA: hypothetical protein VGI19_17035, partial [Candidatus Cybelea sp.]